MKLGIKFNLVLVFTFVLGITAAGMVSYQILQQNARDEILHTASIIMASALSIRSYTVNEVKPLLEPHMTDKFLPQTVPAYAATQNILGLREKYPEYTYKEATLNPTNPVSRATDWEISIVEYFRNNDDAKELVGEHGTAVGPSLYVAHPIKITNEACLGCHGNKEDAPTAMLASYGDTGGFGWKMNEIVGAQIVNVPMSVALDRAQKTFQTFMLSLSLVFLVIIVLLNVLLQTIVIKPVKRISTIANDVSMGNLEAPELHIDGKDELATLGESFNRMRRSLDNAMKMIDD